MSKQYISIQEAKAGVSRTASVNAAFSHKPYFSNHIVLTHIFLH